MGSRLWAGWILWSLSLSGVGWSGLDIEADWFGGSWGPTTPSLSPYSDWDIKETLHFTKKPGTPWIQKPVKRVLVTAYTDRPTIWTTLRYRSVMRLAQWYLARCRIRIDIPKLRVLPHKTLTHKRLVRWKVPRPLIVSKDPAETLLLFTHDVQYYWGRGSQRRRYRLLGVSSTVWVEVKRNHWLKRHAVWTRLSPVYTTLAHELGHRLGLPHVSEPYRLMVTGSGVRGSLTMLWTSFLGYMAPQRFRFTPQECLTMHKTLHKQRKRRHKKGKR